MAIEYHRVKSSPILDEYLMMSESELNQPIRFDDVGQNYYRYARCGELTVDPNQPKCSRFAAPANHIFFSYLDVGLSQIKVDRRILLKNKTLCKITFHFLAVKIDAFRQ
jgi:hypothetical protein